ncbi:MAG: hypothetical protein IJC74_02905 [Clostridia bacterium]|nr:hypothetical protein [Clostridia bacterium]
MLLKEILNVLDAKPVCAYDENIEIKSVCACDLMSDVLAFVKEQSMLLTGLNNPQTVRTAEMMDMKAIILVRGKTPDEEVIKLANEKGIALLRTDLTMYVCAGKLYSAGITCKQN